MRMLHARPGWSQLRATVIGLGVGATSPWSAAGQGWTYIEIDPDVIDFAQSAFSYVAGAAGDVTLVEGDGRIQIEAMPDHSQDLIVLDAYQGDSIPTHLLTDEAFAVYRSKLAPGGVIVAHVTNRYLNLAPVVASTATANGMTTLEFTNPDQPGTAT
jgi:spermidine synthase